MRRVVVGDDADTVKLAGIVQDVTFLRDHSKYHVVLRDGREIVYKEGASSGVNSLNVGDAISIAFSISDVSYFSN